MVNIVTVDVTRWGQPKDNAFASIYFSTSKADKYSVSFLGLSRHEQNNTSHQPRRLACGLLPWGGQFDRINSRLRPEPQCLRSLIVSHTKSTNPSHYYFPPVTIHFTSLTDVLWQSSWSVQKHLDLFNVSISGQDFISVQPVGGSSFPILMIKCPK